MVEIRNRVFVRGVTPKGKLALPFDRRTKTRQQDRDFLAAFEHRALPRGEVLRGGDLVAASDGRIIEVVASAEAVLHITGTSPRELARAAYHLGNRHVPVEVGEGYLRIAADHVLEDMLRGLGATIEPMSAAFEPEAGAYSGGHHGHDHDHDHHHAHEEGPPPHPARIHEFGKKHD